MRTDKLRKEYYLKEVKKQKTKNKGTFLSSCFILFSRTCPTHGEGPGG